MIRIIFSTLALFALMANLNSQTIILKADDSCLNRMEYAGAEMGGAYISYAANLGNGKILSLDIGTENEQWVNELPGKLSYCSDLKMDKNFVQLINNGALKLYIARQSPTQFNISLVNKASYFEQTGNEIDFTGEDADFTFSTGNLISDINLAKPTSKMQVYMDGTLRIQCATGYILSRKESLHSTTFKEYVLMPGVGIVERSSVSATGQTSRLKLKMVGGNSYEQYIASYCDKLQASYYDRTGGLPSNYDNIANQGQNIPSSYGGDPCAPSQRPGLHVVQKGETLYGISRLYGISVAKLQTWNRIENTDVISLCQQLYVADPATVKANNEQASSTPEVVGKGAEQAYWLNAPKVHTVQIGETVASLAYMYGYTEERFRKMNGLGANEQIMAGQILRSSDCVCPTLESSTSNQPLPYEAKQAAIPTQGSDVYFRPIKVHQVQASETLYSIAKLYDTTVERILELNGMKNGDAVKLDQRIYVQ